MRIHKVIQKNLEEQAEEQRQKEFVIEKEKELIELLKSAGLSRIAFKTGWWIFSIHYKIDMDSTGYLSYHSSLQYKDNGRCWNYCGYQENKYEILSYLMS